MGKPLHKRNFGHPANPGSQLLMIAIFDSLTGPEFAYVVKQKGTYWFIVRDVATNTKQMLGHLVTKNLADLNVGEIILEVQVDVDGIPTIMKTRSIQAHRVKAYDPATQRSYDKPWHYGAPTSEKARISHA